MQGGDSMKKSFAAIFITLVGSIFVLSQAETAPTPDWKIFAPEQDAFSVETPIALNASVFQNEEQSRRYLNSLDGTYFYIFSDASKKAWQCKFVKEFVKAQGQTGTTETVGDFETEKFAFSDDINFFHTILIAKNKDRCYLFQTVSPTMENASVEQFFKSLKLKNQPANAKTFKSTDETAVNITVKTKEPEIKKPAPVVKVTPGSGNGESSNYQDTKPARPTGPAIGVKILTKPRANYTEAARFYEMTGKVMLRVVFSANGTIGAVTPVNKLPFGLTEQAMIAAGGITFEPATRGDAPFSVVKPVVYLFTLY